MIKRLVFLVVSGSLLCVHAASPAIGFVRSNGEFRVDGATVRGNSSLSEGNVIETAGVRSTLELNGGRMTLGPESRIRVFRDRTILEKGSGMLRDAVALVMEAGSLRIVPSAKEAVVDVNLKGPSSVAVAARNGAAEVRTSSGMLVAALRPGMALAFDAHAGASGAVTLHGKVELRDGKYFLTDPTANVTVQLVGSVSDYVGKNVEIHGSTIPGATPAAGASQVVQVVGVKVASAAGAAAAAAHTGLGVGAKVAIISGVAVASGTGIGFATGALGGEESPASRQ